MAQEQFIKLDAKAVTGLLLVLNPQLIGTEFLPAQTVVMAQPLSFYPSFHFLDVADFSQQPPVRRFALYQPGRAIVLDGTMEPLTILNAENLLLLNDETVVPYTKFFLQQVRGPHGSFKLVETLDDISWREEPPPPVRKILNELLDGLRVAGHTAEGGFILTGRLLFGDALFAARLTIHVDGSLQFDREELLRGELSVRDEILGQ